MGTWIVQIRRRSRREFPTTLWFQGSPEEARELEGRVRALFEAGAIKDFLFEPVEAASYGDVDAVLVEVERGTPPARRAAMSGTDAENDAEYRRGWAAGLALLQVDWRRAYEWEETVSFDMAEPSWYDMGKSDVISEHRVARSIR
jgi:hypothetical protein